MALFLEVRDNFSEGLRFYMSLQEAISHLAQQVGDYSMTRQIQRYPFTEAFVLCLCTDVLCLYACTERPCVSACSNCAQCFIIMTFAAQITLLSAHATNSKVR